MKERGILFKPEMIKAILEGRKTQTRRIIKPQPESFELSGISCQMIRKARYQPGDMLYIKEGYAICHHVIGKHTGKQGSVAYKSDGKNCDCKWISPLFMPKSAARTWVEVLSVRVERVQDISKKDAVSEGIEPMGKGYKDYACKNHWTHNPVRSFWTLWDSINTNPKPEYHKKQIRCYVSYPWKNSNEDKWNTAVKGTTVTHRGKPLIVYHNPWVYVYEFEVVKDER